MELTLKIGSILSLLSIGYQDYKERKVSLYLFILAGAFVSMLYFSKALMNVVQQSITINILIVALILVILFGYTWFKRKQLLFEVFGLGDAIFFFIFACGFPTVSFIILFTCSLIFALLIFLITRSKLKSKTVPLAGLQALFLVLLFSLNWMFNLVNLYQ